MANDRVMPCGSPAMLRDLKKMLESRGFREGNTTKPGDFVMERACAEQEVRVSVHVHEVLPHETYDRERWKRTGSN